MARWLKPLGAASAIALLGHGLALWWWQAHWLAAHSVLQPMAEPMFTRQITQLPAQAAGVQAANLRATNSRTANALAATKVLSNNKPFAGVSIEKYAIENVANEAPASLPVAPTPTAQLGPAAGLEPVVSQTETTALASPAAPDPQATLQPDGSWPADTRLSYTLGGLMRGPLHGDASVQWTRSRSSAAFGSATVSAADSATGGVPSALEQSEKYQVRIDINIGYLARARLTSQGRLTAAGLQPEVYQEQLPNAQRSVRISDAAVLLASGEQRIRPEAVQDTASQFVDLGHRFLTGRAVLAEGRSISVWLARPGGVDEWTYDIGPAETLYLPQIGLVQAYPLKPRPLAQARGPITAEMWFAPALQNLPVRIKINLNAQTYLDLLLEKIEQR